MTPRKKTANEPQQKPINLPALANAKGMADAYLFKDVITDFASLAEHQKLSVLQVTPKDFIKEREIAGNKIKYVEHTYAKKCLNFVFAFRVSCELIKEEYREIKEPFWNYKHKNCKKDNYGKIIPVRDERDATEAEVTMKFTFNFKDGTQITRTVVGTHKGYPNAAITRGDIKKAAISKTWTGVAETFGIGAELEKDHMERVYSQPDVPKDEVSMPDMVDKDFIDVEAVPMVDDISY